MPKRRHRRHLKLHNECFAASDAVDFLHKLLKNNHNIGSEVTRLQTIQLLRKFLKNHVIEDVQGRWGTENVNDDNHLFRFAEKGLKAKKERKPFETIDENVVVQDKNKKKSKPVKQSKSKLQKENTFSKSHESIESESMSSGSISPTNPPIPHRPLPPVPQCKVTSKIITEVEINGAWRDVIINKLKKSLKLESLDDLIMPQDINGAWVKQNVTNVGRSGVVQVSIDNDLPYWTLSAMTCLANWPNSKDTGLPCYPGFESDVFKAVCEYYCRTPANNNNDGKKSTNDHIYAEVGSSKSTTEPLLTYRLYELFTNALCMLRPETQNTAIEVLQLSLLLLPPANRRKLHLLLRLMAKVSVNPHLTKLNPHMPTRVLLLHTFSRHILSCFEEVYLDELLAMRLVTFLIDYHMQVMKVPEGLKQEVEQKIEILKKPQIRYADGDLEGSFVQYSYFPSSDHLPPTAMQHLPRSKSVDVMKSLTLGRKPKPVAISSLAAHNQTNKYAKHRRSMTFELRDQAPSSGKPHKHSRSSTITSRVFNLRTKESKNQLKPAQSCPDICDRITINPSPTTNLNPKTSAMSASNRNLKFLLNKLRRNKS
uniref:DEP domain-containing protein 1A-like n=1 Tax=Phallusia mammillata TaxID=59560 RepID=A0A6F9DBF6_9ASCI|nr:DEP domain-containing protein 1A-like [Phallusia mammillata]